MPPKAARRGAASAPRRNNGAEAATNTPAGSATPAATPSESQAPTPSAAGPSSTRPPVQRLQSLKKQTPSGSIRPAARTATPANGDASKPALKYQPRAVGRRSKEEREAMEKLEAQRHRERLKEAAAIQRGRGNVGQRGRGGMRGRGGPMGMGASGPLGAGMAGRRGRGGRFGTDSRDVSMSRSRTRSVIDMGSVPASRDISSDESETETLLAIDQIEIDSDEDLDNVTDGKKGKTPLRYAEREKGLRPVRVERHEHEERLVSVNMESSTSKPAETRQQEEAKAAEDNDLFVQEDEGAEPRVKEEPKDEDQAMTDAVPHADENDDGFLPAQRAKVRRRLTPKTPEPEVEIQPEPVAPRDPRSLLRTKEDIEEYERHAKDLEATLELLSIEPKKPRKEEQKPSTEEIESPVEGPETAGPDTAADKDKEEGGEVEEGEKEEEEEEEDDKLSGQLFLIQFPSMTPNLILPGTSTDNPDELTEITNQTAPETPASRGRSEAPAVKREDGDVQFLEDGDELKPKVPPKVVTATDWQLGAGRVGKLNVHASGRVTMDWGGISFELDRATSVDFLQEALIVSSTEPDVPAEENRVWAMGQLSGKFTVAPDWEKML